MRNTPMFPLSLFSGSHDFIATASPSPSTVRVSDGAMIPSSHLPNDQISFTFGGKLDGKRKGSQSGRTKQSSRLVLDLRLELRRLVRVPAKPNARQSQRQVQVGIQAGRTWRRSP